MFTQDEGMKAAIKKMEEEKKMREVPEVSESLSYVPKKEIDEITGRTKIVQNFEVLEVLF